MNFPFPFYAHPLIKAYEHPLPIPIEWHRLYFVYRPTKFITPSVLDTPPSVSRNICLG